MANDSKYYWQTRSYGNSPSPGSRSIIPRVTLSTFGRSKFTWLLQEAWGEQDLRDFLQFSQNEGWNHFRKPAHVGRNCKASSQPVGKWLLKDDHGSAIAAAEVLIAETGFSCVSVNLLLADERNRCPRLPEALSYFISALFMITGSDVIHCYVVGGDIKDILAKMPGKVETETIDSKDGVQAAPGNVRRIYAVRREIFVCDDDWSLPVKEINFWEITPSLWWECASAKRDKEDLKYLEKRIDYEQRLMDMGARQGRSKKNPFSLFSKFFQRR